MTKKETLETQKEDDEKSRNEEKMNLTDESKSTEEEKNVQDEVIEDQKEEKDLTDTEKSVIDEKEEKTAHGASKKKKVSREKELEAKLKEQHDKYLRLSAEFDNYRKRMMKERIELTQYAAADILTKILPFMDDFERAMVSMKTSQDAEAVRQGIELIYNKFKEYISQQGIKEIDAMNQEFNTDFHDAVTRFPVQEEDKKGKVVDVIVKGYTLNDKVIRYSRVVVGE
jgi:molecular chaperone GrpE